MTHETLNQLTIAALSWTWGAGFVYLMRTYWATTQDSAPGLRLLFLVVSSLFAPIGIIIDLVSWLATEPKKTKL